MGRESRGGSAMKKVLLYSILAGLLISQFMLTYPAVAEVKPPEVGSILPEIILNVPKEPEHQKYLGLTGEGTFKIPEIKGEVVIFEIYSMYCPFCQKEAPIVNQLFQKIESNEDLKGKVKLIGIGVGNSVFEVDFFRKTYDVKFPLFPDVDFSVHKVMGEVRTPYFVGIKIHADGTHTVVYSKLGTIKNADEFLSLIVQLSGL
jgi:thiol-disulfide isomerase/thioredoxin